MPASSLCLEASVNTLSQLHYHDVIMTTTASQITSLTVVYSDADQRKHQSSASLAFVWGIHRDRWIPRTKGQLRGRCFHLMTSSWHTIIWILHKNYNKVVELMYLKFSILCLWHTIMSIFVSRAVCLVLFIGLVGMVRLQMRTIHGRL